MCTCHSNAKASGFTNQEEHSVVEKPVWQLKMNRQRTSVHSELLLKSLQLDLDIQEPLELDIGIADEEMGILYI